MSAYPDYPDGFWALPIAISSNAYHFFPKEGQKCLCKRYIAHMTQIEHREAVKSVDCVKCRQLVDPVKWLKLTDGQWKALRGAAIYNDPAIDCRTMQAHGGRALAVRSLYRRGLMLNGTVSRLGIAFFEAHATGGEMAVRTITIPACENHEGHHALKLHVNWHCLQCGAIRGEPFQTTSYDGSRRLDVTGWNNPCGHVESYASVREQAAKDRGEGEGA